MKDTIMNDYLHRKNVKNYDKTIIRKNYLLKIIKLMFLLILYSKYKCDILKTRE